METNQVLRTIRGMKNTILMLERQIKSIENRILEHSEHRYNKMIVNRERCSNCGCYNTRARIKKGDYVCKSCGNIFKKSTQKTSGGKTWR